MAHNEIERIEINLLPAEYRIHRGGLKIQREVIYPLLLLLVCTIGFTFWSFGLKFEISRLGNEISAIDRKIQQNRPIQNEINELRTNKNTVQEKIRALERISVNKEKWVSLMEIISENLPQYSWLVSIKEQNSMPPVLHLEGRTYSFPDVANYMSNLSESEYVQKVDLANIEQIDSKLGVYRFSLSCTVNPDMKLEKIVSLENAEDKGHNQ